MALVAHPSWKQLHPVGLNRRAAPSNFGTCFGTADSEEGSQQIPHAGSKWVPNEGSAPPIGLNMECAPAGRLSCLAPIWAMR